MSPGTGVRVMKSLQLKIMLSASLPNVATPCSLLQASLILDGMVQNLRGFRIQPVANWHEISLSILLHRIARFSYSRGIQIMQHEKPRFKSPWHFCRTDFQCDEWMCRVCDRFGENEHKPVLYRKRDALKHEETLEHVDNVEKFREYLTHYPDQLHKYTSREFGEATKGDPLFPDEVYESLAEENADARFGVEYINQFVEFWKNDVAAAANEPGPCVWPEERRCIRGREGRRERMRELGRGKQREKQRRRTFAEFFDSLELVWGEYVFEDGWWVKRKNGPDAEGWVTQIRKTRTKKGFQVERVVSQNKFALLQGDHDDVEEQG